METTLCITRQHCEYIPRTTHVATEHDKNANVVIRSRHIVYADCSRPTFDSRIDAESRSKLV